MKFKEASPDRHGCNEIARFLKFPKTAKIQPRDECPHQGLRCCLFCSERCNAKCVLAAVFQHQPKQWQDEFDCPCLVENQLLVWKYLLGPNVPKFG